MRPESEDDSSTGSGALRGRAAAHNPDDDAKPESSGCCRLTWPCAGRSLALLAIIGLAAYVVIDSMTTMHLTRWYEGFLEWLRE